MPPSFTPRENYRALLEPADRVLHGAGQSPEAFARYVHALGPDAHPALYMHYTGLKHLPPGPMSALEACRAAYPEVPLIPQIGLSMTKDGSPEQHYEHDVAAGLYDAQIENLAESLRAFDAPVFLRIGYEFNGQWNGYERESFVAAWRRIVDALRAAGADQVATVWCFAEEGNDKDFMQYYPGDEYVDWWSIDLFDKEHLVSPFTEAFLDAAEAHRKPVMIGESTARRVGVHGGEASWKKWYAPYFDLIRRRPGIKAFCYINWNWAAYPMWHDWGDCRIEENPAVLEAFRKELACPLYLHASP